MPGGADPLPTLDDLAGDPHPHLARLRAETPVVEVPALGGWLATGRAACVEILHDPDTFTVDDPRFSTAQVVGRSMLSTDGDEHARHRAPFVAPFRRRRVEADLGGALRAEVTRLVDPLVARRSAEAELRTELAGPLAASAMAMSLGLDGSDEALVGRLLGWYRDIVASVAGVAAGRVVTAVGAEAMTELRAVLRPAVDDEAMADAAVVLFGGIETTEGMILNALRHVLVEPGVRTAVLDEPALLPAAVEESLRLEPAAAVVDRYATRDASVGGVAVPGGALVVVSLAGANRDPAEFPAPDRFDLHRPNLRRQLAFATGPHVCLGMDLARLETNLALSEVLTRLPGLTLDAGAPSPTGLVFRKPARLPVRWSPPRR